MALLGHMVIRQLSFLSPSHVLPRTKQVTAPRANNRPGPTFPLLFFLSCCFLSLFPDDCQPGKISLGLLCLPSQMHLHVALFCFLLFDFFSVCIKCCHGLVFPPQLAGLDMGVSTQVQRKRRVRSGSKCLCGHPPNKQREWAQKANL